MSNQFACRMQSRGGDEPIPPDPEAFDIERIRRLRAESDEVSKMLVTAMNDAPVKDDCDANAVPEKPVEPIKGQPAEETSIKTVPAANDEGAILPTASSRCCARRCALSFGNLPRSKHGIEARPRRWRGKTERRWPRPSKKSTNGRTSISVIFC